MRGRLRSTGARRVGALLAIALATVALASGVAAQGGETPQEPKPLTGTLHIESDLRVEEGETLAIGPNATLTGPGRVLVYGTLDARGSALEPVTFRVPVYVFGDGDARLRNVAFELVPGFSLFLESGSAIVEDAVFDGSDGGGNAITVVGARGPIDLTIRDSVFHDYSRAGLAIEGPSRVSVSGSTFSRNAWGIDIGLVHEAVTDLTVSTSTFSGQTVNHVNVDVPQGEGAPSRVLLTASRFLDLAASPDAEPRYRAALALRERDSGENWTAPRLDVSSTANLFARNPVGVYAYSAPESRSIAFSSIGDVFEANGIGVHAHHASLTIEGATFTQSGEWDVYAPYAPADGAPLVVLTNSSYDRARIGVDAGAAAVQTDSGLIRGAAVAVGTVGVLGVAITIFKSGARQAIIHLMFVPLYARLKAGEILAHEKRKSILEYVTANPGAHMRRIGHALEISYGALTYHIYRLEKEGYLTSREEGLFKRFYPATGGVRSKAETAPMPTSLRRLERDILDAIIAEPGQPQSAIAASLGLSRQALHYHIKKLEQRGFITKVPQGRETLLYAKDEAIAATREAEAAQDALRAPAVAADGDG